MKKKFLVLGLSDKVSGVGLGLFGSLHLALGPSC